MQYSKQHPVAYVDRAKTAVLSVMRTLASSLGIKSLRSANAFSPNRTRSPAMSWQNTSHRFPIVSDSSLYNRWEASDSHRFRCKLVYSKIHQAPRSWRLQIIDSQKASDSHQQTDRQIVDSVIHRRLQTITNRQTDRHRRLAIIKLNLTKL